ncbi:unnamed protein product, partial [Closterium sp. NIES-54]
SQPAHPPVSGLGAIATFTTYELLPYRSLVFYTVILSVVALDWVAVEQKVIDTPEILTVIDQIPHLGPFVNNLHACDYKAFFRAFCESLIGGGCVCVHEGGRVRGRVGVKVAVWYP